MSDEQQIISQELDKITKHIKCFSNAPFIKSKKNATTVANVLALICFESFIGVLTDRACARFTCR